MTEDKPTKPNKPAAPANTLESALAFYTTRENHDLLEGILRPDNNIPGNEIIVVSSTEFYSVPTADILEREGAPTGHPQRVWVKKGAEVWHFQKTALDIQGEAPLTKAELPGLFSDLVANHPAFSQLSARVSPESVSATLSATTVTKHIPCTGFVRYSNPPLKAPRLSQIEKRVVAVSDRPGLSPIRDGTKVADLMKLPSGRNASQALAINVMQDEAGFANDGLRIQDTEIKYVETLKEFATYILECYTHQRITGS
jgi:hypothetical protein